MRGAAARFAAPWPQPVAVALVAVGASPIVQADDLPAHQSSTLAPSARGSAIPSLIESWSRGTGSRSSDKVDRDDEETAERAELDDCLGLESADCGAADDELALVGLAVALALDDFAGEKDVFEIEDRKVVMIKFFYSVL